MKTTEVLRSPCGDRRCETLTTNNGRNWRKSSRLFVTQRRPVSFGMSLSQHFYFQGEHEKDRADRKDIYVKSRIAKRPMWEMNEFWDQALDQAVGESLAHRGVMANFERASNKILTSTNKKRSEWTQTHKTRWHDLTVEKWYGRAQLLNFML
jgi:hypothetical protein